VDERDVGINSSLSRHPGGRNGARRAGRTGRTLCVTTSNARCGLSKADGVWRNIMVTWPWRRLAGIPCAQPRTRRRQAARLARGQAGLLLNPPVTCLQHGVFSASWFVLHHRSAYAVTSYAGALKFICSPACVGRSTSLVIAYEGVVWRRHRCRRSLALQDRRDGGMVAKPAQRVRISGDGGLCAIWRA